MASKWSGLTKRVSTALMLALVSFATIWWGVVPFALEATFLALGASAEFFDLVERKGLRPLRRTGTIAVVSLLWTATFYSESALTHLLLAEFIVFMAVVVARAPSRISALLDACATWMGVAYVGWLFSYCVLIRRLGETPAQGAFLLVWLILIVAATDIGAYFVGRQFGRHPLWASVSPKKTLEGSLGGMLVAILFGSVGASFFGVSAGHGAMLAMLVSVSGQMGDLWESALKRDVKVKDAGDLIRGHGGVLDRFDSLAFAAPVFYLYWAFVLH